MKAVVEDRPAALSLSAACRALGLNRSTLYARQKPARTQTQPAPQKARRQPRALTDAERQTALALMNSDAYCDQPPVQVYQTLLDQGHYLCSVRTMHRILHASQEHGERRSQRPPQNHAEPRLVARAPNEVWTWDITKLATCQRGVYLNLYVVLDLFSRYIVAWMISRKENSALAQQLMNETIIRYGIQNPICDFGNQHLRDIGIVNFLEGIDHVSSAHALPVERQNLVIDLRQAVSVHSTT